jgi:long-chain acyl-CoA synthetase
MHLWEEVVDKGREAALEPQETKLPETDDCFMICYTSGQGGDPKGVMVTHKMIVQQAGALQVRLGTNKLSESSDTYFSHLSASHILEQSMFAICMIYSIKIGFQSESLNLDLNSNQTESNKQLISDMAILKPTVFASIPKQLRGFFLSI